MLLKVGVLGEANVAGANLVAAGAQAAVQHAEVTPAILADSDHRLVAAVKYAAYLTGACHERHPEWRG